MIKKGKGLKSDEQLQEKAVRRDIPLVRLESMVTSETPILNLSAQPALFYRDMGTDARINPR